MLNTQINKIYIKYICSKYCCLFLGKFKVVLINLAIKMNCLKITKSNKESYRIKCYYLSWTVFQILDTFF